MGFEMLRAGRETPPDNPREALLKETSDRAVAEGVRNWTSVPGRQPLLRDQLVDRTYGKGMLGRLEDFRLKATSAADRARPILFTALKDRDPTAELRLQKIFDALKAAPPVYGDKPSSTEHPYLYLRTTKPLHAEDKFADKLSMYRIREGKVEADVKFLEDLHRSMPGPRFNEARASIDSLIMLLRVYAPLDPKIAVQRHFDNVLGKSPADAAIHKMGRMALIGALGAATVIFGAIGLVNFIRKGQLTVTPFLYGFATWLLIDPSLRRSLFGTKYDKEFAEIESVTRSAKLRNICKDYSVGGPPWGKVVEKVYDEKSLKLSDFRRPTEEKIRDTVRDLSGGDKAIAASIEAMIRNPDKEGKSHFETFVEEIRKAKKEDAKQFIIDYIKEDAVRYGLAHDPTAGKVLEDAVIAKNIEQDDMTEVV